MEGHEVTALLKPAQAATDAVLSWLQEHNVTSIEDDSDWINFDTTVATANKLLETEFAWYRSDYKGKERLRTLEYSVPDLVARHINLVQPTTRFGSMEPLRAQEIESQPMAAVNTKTQLFRAAKAGAIDPVCNTTITPQCLLKLYNVHYGADPKSNNKVAFGSFLEEYARYADLEEFEENIAPYALGQNYTVVQFNGGLNNQTSTDDSGEANLDGQYIVGVGHPVPVTEYSTGGRGPLVPDLDQPAPPGDNEPYLECKSIPTQPPSKPPN
jgi:tripeptidyl-peptidase-1